MSDTERMARVFDAAIRRTSDTTAHYGPTWQQQGWRGNLAAVLEHAQRLRATLWRTSSPLLSGEDQRPQDAAIEMINSLVHMVVNMDDGREWGDETPRDEYRGEPQATAAETVTDTPTAITTGADPASNIDTVTWDPAAWTDHAQAAADQPAPRKRGKTSGTLPTPA